MCKNILAKDEATSPSRLLITWLWTLSDQGLMLFTKYPIQVCLCSAFDDMEHITPNAALPDLIYIKEFRATTIDELTEQLPYHGQAWYMRPAVEYLLHTKKIECADLQYIQCHSSCENLQSRIKEYIGQLSQ